MTTRMVVAGRVIYSNAPRRKPASAALNMGRDRQGNAIKLEGSESPALAMPRDRRAEPFTAGVPFACPIDRCTYRVVARLNYEEAWAPTQFWQARWRISHLGVLELARAGLLDAVIEQGSQVRRYRCRDERAVLESEPVQRAVRLRRSQHANAAKKSKAPTRKPWV